MAPVSCAASRRPCEDPRSSATVSRQICAALVSLLLAAPFALADNGVGLAGPTTDKTVTFFCFGVIAFFAILVIGCRSCRAASRRAKNAAAKTWSGCRRIGVLGRCVRSTRRSQRYS